MSTQPVLEFVQYFEKRATQINEKIAKGAVVTHEICQLIRETIENTGPGLCFALLRGEQHKWAQRVDVDDVVRIENDRRLPRLRWRGWYPYQVTGFHHAEVEVANDAGLEAVYVGFHLNKNLMDVLSAVMHDPSLRYSSLESVCRHAIWRYICWMDEKRLHICHAGNFEDHHRRLRRVEKDELESHFYVAILALRRLFENWDGVTPPDLRRIRSYINSFESICWRNTYLEEFDKYFGPSEELSERPNPDLKKVLRRRVSLDPANFDEGETE